MEADGNVMLRGDGEDVDGFVGGGADCVFIVDGSDRFDLVVQILRHRWVQVGVTSFRMLRSYVLCLLLLEDRCVALAIYHETTIAIS